MQATASFKVTTWEPTPYEAEVEGPRLFRVKVCKAFSGDLAGESTGELLMCVADPADIAAGAGYVVSERVTGTLGERSGSFMLQHWGLSGGGAAPRTAGHVVPGSGTGALAGITGRMEISDDAGAHTLILDYELA